ncbi:hypothetical protein DYB32_004414 [Aphanomyces invadans]|uniref:CID domain-containing protein n=1 Tax=Aphanomyces invadans TaxID=157072 RepID=A0A3R6WMG8_9STRA|nr:hypothetical protein DYB32_004414 [Aphanomyces invadans]
MINEMGAYPAKPIINTLTMLAEDLALAKHIAPFLVKKLNVVGPPYRLPILYLMDSIIKNVGGPYAFLFSQTLAPVYVDSVRQVNATDLNRFNHVLKTWETARLLPSAVLLKMRAAADAALRVAQPSDQPASFSRGGAPPASRGVPPRSSDAHLELQMRRLLTQLQTEDGVHPAKQVSLEEVRTQNPELYAHLRLSVVEAELSKHMDFLFHYNRALRERTKGGISRSWYPNEAVQETSAGFVQAEAKTAVPEEWMYQNAVVGTIRTNDVVPKHTIFHKYCYDSAVASSKSEGILPSQLAPGSPVVVMGKRSMSQVDDNGKATWGADRGRSDEQEQQQQDINKRLKVTHRDDGGDVL